MNESPVTSDHDKLEKMYSALFGDDETGELGLMEMNRQMYEVFASLRFFGKIATWFAIILAGVGAVGGVIFAIAKKIFNP